MAMGRKAFVAPSATEAVSALSPATGPGSLPLGFSSSIEAFQTVYKVQMLNSKSTMMSSVLLLNPTVF